MFSIGSFSRSFPFRVTYEQVLYDVEQADDKEKKIKRAPRSYEQSDKKLKTTKIVTKKGDLTSEENKKNKKKKPKQMAGSNKPIETAVQDENEVDEEEEEEEEGNEEENLVQEKNINDVQEQSNINDDENNESSPIDEVQQPMLSVAEKLQALGKKPAPFSKATAKYDDDFVVIPVKDVGFF